MYDDSQIKMQETTLLGHIGGNLVMRDRSRGLLVSNTISVCSNFSFVWCHPSDDSVCG
jgi:hypothetical protein